MPLPVKLNHQFGVPTKHVVGGKICRRGRCHSCRRTEAIIELPSGALAQATGHPRERHSLLWLLAELPNYSGMWVVRVTMPTAYSDPRYANGLLLCSIEHYRRLGTKQQQNGSESRAGETKRRGGPGWRHWMCRNRGRWATVCAKGMG